MPTPRPIRLRKQACGERGLKKAVSARVIASGLWGCLMKIAQVQLVRKAVLAGAIVLGVAMFAVTTSETRSGEALHEMIEWCGIVAIVTCILGRTWCSLYIAGRKIEQFVTEGPYSISRNPLYLFSIIGSAGAGAQLGSIVAAVLFGAIAFVVFYVVVLQEERVLAERYGQAFANYLATVPRFLPNPTLWRDAPTVTVKPAKLLQTFGDAMFLLVWVPLSEGCELLQHHGVLPVLLRLP
jgi:protein-S-isoprenylcysteine O-methyltransferase Ste14